MKQVRQRTALIALLLALLLVGVALFCVRYVTQGRDWASFGGNSSVYGDGVLATGQILDRSGVVLFDAPSQSYADSYLLRCATLHAVGDMAGNISTSALNCFEDQMMGYSLLNGTTGGGCRVYLTLDSELNTDAYEALDGRKGTVGIYKDRKSVV